LIQVANGSAATRIPGRIGGAQNPPDSRHRGRIRSQRFDSEETLHDRVLNRGHPLL
jgi:hypothetical protein